MAQSGTWPKVRKFFNDIHLWGGLISGLVVFVVCLTGTIYVYNTEIREASLSSYYKVADKGDRLPADVLLEKTEPHIKGKVVGIKIPAAADATVAVLFNKPEKDKGGKPDGAKDKGEGVKEGNTLMKRDVVPVEKEKRGPEEGATKPANEQDGATKGAGKKGESVGKAQGGGPQGGGGRRRSNQMMVNPYTGVAIGDASEEKNKTASFMQVMFGLHRWLLLNEIEEPIFEGVENRKLGSWITGSATLLFLVGVLSGLVIWFPQKMRAWKNGLTVKWSANWKRINHDLHNTLGLYTWIFLFLMSVTGPFWSFDWYREGWQKTWGTYQKPSEGKEEKAKPESQVILGKTAMNVEETLAVVNKILPYKGDVTINFAKDSTGTLTVTKNKVGFFAPSAGDKLVLDQYSGAILEKDIFTEKSLRNRIGASVKALHIGDVYGPFTKLLYFISCLVATSLPVTGVLIWVNKMKKKPKRGKVSRA
ncbi:PepSY-associated TM helix domain-containing protein [Sphingobacterium psychroaquaticum]|uniref:PepSY-associated TM region n=1 Tax=Sphingobacterium psychroaquaticum TaxID=561061 RepID=A0A1X7KHL8_9SPHI|nr:PepSY-associated TM helix domain-containing protein [Sphingobacterium psychroaquaticum]QBQ42780.1 PepSY domain-containing protein [Sphingobacterium psychroaquaticum]SMG40493.1 PepSY-associated TM region [Sphingobacterium psychroaquaticum]